LPLQPRRYSTAIFALAAAAYLLWGGELPESFAPFGNSAQQSSPRAVSNEAIVSAFRAERSDVVVEGGGEVVAVLPDDTRGAEHQRFLVSVAPDHTVLISHNIDLAPRVEDIRRGDTVYFRGQYEWNDRGGVVHWTHHDPRGRRPGGWIERRGRRYD
jgi:hypothetical protein